MCLIVRGFCGFSRRRLGALDASQRLDLVLSEEESRKRSVSLRLIRLKRPSRKGKFAMDLLIPETCSEISP